MERATQVVCRHEVTARKRAEMVDTLENGKNKPRWHKSKTRKWLAWHDLRRISGAIAMRKRDYTGVPQTVVAIGPRAEQPPRSETRRSEMAGNEEGMGWLIGQISNSHWHRVRMGLSAPDHMVSRREGEEYEYEEPHPRAPIAIAREHIFPAEHFHRKTSGRSRSGELCLRAVSRISNAKSRIISSGIGQVR